MKHDAEWTNRLRIHAWTFPVLSIERWRNMQAGETTHRFSHQLLFILFLLFHLYFRIQQLLCILDSTPHMSIIEHGISLRPAQPVSPYYTIVEETFDLRPPFHHFPVNLSGPLSGRWMWGRWKSNDGTGAQQEMVGSRVVLSNKRCRGLGINYGRREDNNNLRSPGLHESRRSPIYMYEKSSYLSITNSTRSPP